MLHICTLFPSLIAVTCNIVLCIVLKNVNICILSPGAAEKIQNKICWTEFVLCDYFITWGTKLIMNITAVIFIRSFFCSVITVWTEDFQVVRLSPGLLEPVSGACFTHSFILCIWESLLEGWFNSLWPSDPIWCHRAGSTLAQVVACCLAAPSHYLIQFWLLVSEVL